MVEIHPQRIRGKWRSGYALDFHTTSSTPIGENAYGHMQFDTVRPPVAELLYQLKYRNDEAAVAEISKVAAAFLRQEMKRLIASGADTTRKSRDPVAQPYTGDQPAVQF